MRRRTRMLKLFLVGVATLASSGLASAATITEFPVPTANSGPDGIVAGADGNLWFTENGGNRIGRNRIGRITPAGTITEYPIPTANSYPRGIAAGPDGNLWFTEALGNRIGRVTPDPPPSIGPPDSGAGPAPTPGPGPARVPSKTTPTLSSIKLASTSVKAGTSLSLSYRISEPGTLSVTIQRVSNGHKAKGKCKTRARKGKRCTIYTPLKTLTFKVAHAGKLKIPTTIKGKKLARGNYRLRITPINAGGTRGKPRTISFKTKKRSTHAHPE